MKKFLGKMRAWYKEYCQRPDDWENMDYYDRKLFTATACAAFCMVMCPILIIIVIVMLCTQSCAGPSKIQRVQTEEMRASIGLVEEMPGQAAHGADASASLSMTDATPDTLTVFEDNGHKMILMKAVKDENGDMVATDVINAAVVEARFRNVAERHGKVDIAFQIRVSREMQDDAWQLRFYPHLRLLGGKTLRSAQGDRWDAQGDRRTAQGDKMPGQAGHDGEEVLDEYDLESVVITGAKYRRAQLKGYQQYEKFLASIVTDSTRFINVRQLELFIQRNIPDLWAFKADSTEVADEAFNAILDTKVASAYASQYGVTGRDAIEHYTNSISKRLNARRWARRDEMYRKYVRVPIAREGLRLDTVITATNGDFIYNYVQTIVTRPKLHKAEVVLGGEIFEQDKRLYEIPATEPLTYYISSLSAFVDNTPRYKKMIISRRVEANTACYIDFEQGSAEIMEDMSHNRSEMGRIKENLASLIENREFDLDSIVVTASCSPEGTVAFNRRLSQRRSEAVSEYFGAFIRDYRERKAREAEVAYYFDGLSEEEMLRFAQHDKGMAQHDKGMAQHDSPDVKFISRNNPENWRMLDVLIAEDDSLTADQKIRYIDICEIADWDERETALAGTDFYMYLRESLYPRLRTVKFDFHLHRKGMVKDTVQTTVLDEEYMAGVQAIRDRDYETAITLLRPYHDYNAAVAFCAMDYNASALEILEGLNETDQVDYMLAIIYARQGRYADAAEAYIRACRLNPSMVHRGNLDPEITELKSKYNLNRD